MNLRKSQQLAQRLRDYADNPCGLGYVPIWPATLREIAAELDRLAEVEWMFEDLQH